jgi:DNA-binding HxlR family transcriptional regulator
MKPRLYDDACATAHALDLIGERWSMLIMRELMMGPRRFSDLRASLKGLSANVLTQKLEALEAGRVLRREKLPPPAKARAYALTSWGLEAEPILLALGRWGVRSPGHDPTLPFSPVALMLSFRAKFDPAAAKNLDVTMAFTLDGEPFTVAVKAGRLTTARGHPEIPTARISASPPAIAALVYGKVPLATLEGQGALTLWGDGKGLTRFAALYRMPPKAV